MKYESGNLNEMLRRALKAQAELGLGEMIINPEALAAEETGKEAPTVTNLDSDSEVVDMFIGTGPTLGPPQYESLEMHYKDISDCQLCPLAQSRTNFVYGAGNPEADLMFVGEAPGRDEDLRGEPFVGRAGQLLDKILSYDMDLLVLAGFMRVLTPYFIDRINIEPEKYRIMNIHPALLPSQQLQSLQVAFSLQAISSLYFNDLMTRYDCYISG